MTLYHKCLQASQLQSNRTISLKADLQFQKIVRFVPDATNIRVY